MFKSLFKKKLVYDPTLGDPLAKKIRQEAQQGNFTTLLREVPLLRDYEWDRRALYINFAAEQLTQPEPLEKLPDTAFGHLVKGHSLVNLAWEARGGGQAETVTKAGWKSFYEYLNQAAKYLLQAAKEDPIDPTPLAFLQPVAMGLQLEPKIADSWFAEAIRRDPFNSKANHGRLVSLCEKWGGSHEAMYAFARETMARTPTNRTLYSSIIYAAFLEHYLYLRSFERDPEAALAFLNERPIREETVQIFKTSLQPLKIKSVADYWPHNVAACWFMVAQMPSSLRQEIRKIGTHFTEFPWHMFYNDYTAAHQRALELAK